MKALGRVEITQQLKHKKVKSKTNTKAWRPKPKPTNKLLITSHATRVKLAQVFPRVEIYFSHRTRVTLILLRVPKSKAPPGKTKPPLNLPELHRKRRRSHPFFRLALNQRRSSSGHTQDLIPDHRRNITNCLKPKPTSTITIT